MADDSPLTAGPEFCSSIVVQEEKSDDMAREPDNSLLGSGRWLGVPATSLAVFAAGMAGMFFTGPEYFFSPVWPLSGVALGCMLLGGWWMAPGVYAGAVVLNAVSGQDNALTWLGPLSLAGQACGSYWLLTRFLGPNPQLGDLRSVGVFLLAPWLVVAGNGLFATALLDIGMDNTIFFPGREFAIFVMANGMGSVLLAPAFAVWRRNVSPIMDRHAAAGLVLFLAASAAVFFLAPKITPYVLLVPLLAISLLLGSPATAVSVAGLSGISLAAALLGSGPLAVHGGGVEAYAATYVFLAIAAMCSFAVASSSGRNREKLERLSPGARSAGLVAWSWDRENGLRFAESEDAPTVVGEAEEGDFFVPDEDHGVRETTWRERPVLSFWEITARDRQGAAAEAGGLIIDLSSHLTLDQAQRRAWQNEVELRNLRASLAPHLLFNCLAAVRGIVRTDPEQARTFIDHLARFLRDSTNAQARETIPVLDEWQLCEDFLALQAMRFERDLPRVVSIEGAAYHARVPPMLLLNLVENAVKHGEIGQKDPLVVEVHLSDGFLVAKVRNRGVLGPRPASRPGGLGISQARLQAIYGDTASLDIRQDGSHVEAVLRIPAKAPEPV